MVLRAALLSLLLCVACAEKAAPQRVTAAPLPEGSELVAAVEVESAVALWRDEGAGWKEFRRLPKEARALRFSPNSRTIAWMEDGFEGEKPVSFGFVWVEGSSRADPLGEMRLDEDTGVPYRVVDDGVVPSASPGPLIRARRHLETKQTVRMSYDHLWVLEPLPLAEASDGVGNRVIVRRTESAPIVEDEIVLFKRAAEPQVVLSAPVVIGVAIDRDGTVLAIRRPTRKDVYENMLAHAPYEFGGEAIGGDAIRIRNGKIEPVAGLENRSVRALFRAR